MFKKLTMTIVVVLISSAATAATITLDGDTAATGANLSSTPLMTAFGEIRFDGEIRVSAADDELVAAGSTGNIFDIFDSNLAPVAFSFDFNVSSINLIYGGNGGGIAISVRDAFGVILDSFTQDDTGDGQPAGPITLTGVGIRSLEWNDSLPGGFEFAAIDNIELTVNAVPIPATLPLLGAALIGMTGFSRRRRRA